MNPGSTGEGGAAAVRIEDLLAEAGWIRSLARSLVGDGQAADDVVQETWIAVLRRPPRGDRPLRPWLARVVTNFARMQGRSEASRRRREASMARSESLPSSAELVERVEVHQLLTELVVKLDEPLRETVLLRYFGGLSSVEIAERTGTPAGTVRWRLKRGLEELRAELDRRHAGRDGWLPALVAVARTPIELAPAAASPAAPGAAPALAQLAAVVLVAALAVALGLATVRWLAEPAPVSVLQRAAVPGPGANVAASAAAAAGPSLASPSAAIGARTGASPSDSKVHPFVALRVVDQEGRPLAGARLAGTGGRSARTDASGLVALEQPPGLHELRLEAEGCVPHLERVQVAAGAGEVPLGTVVLERAGAVEGRVVDELGLSLPGARVAVEEIGTRWMEAPNQPLEEARYLGGLLQRGAGPVAEVAADATGRFRVEGLAPGFVRLWARAEGRVAAYSTPLGVAPGRTLRAEPLVVRAPREGELVRGRVVDAQGRGVAGARVEAARRSLDPLPFQGEAYATVTRADASGRFELLVDPGARYRLAAVDEAGETAALAVDVSAGAADLRLELAPRERMLLAARDGGELRLKLWDAERGRQLEPDALGDLRPVGGAFELRAPLVAFRLAAERAGCEPVELGPFEPSGVPTELTIQFEPRGGPAGVVLAEGRAVEGASITVLAAHDEREGRLLTSHESVLDGAPFVLRLRPRPWLHRTTTDADGRFRLPTAFTDDPGAGLFLRVDASERPELAPALLGPFADLDALAASGALAIELDRGGSVTGRVRLAGGADPAGVVIGLSVGDGRLRSARAARDGSFRFDGVPFGPVELRRLDGELRSERWQASRGRVREVAPPLAGARFGGLLAPGAVLDVELDLRSTRSTRIEGRFLIDGAPPGPWQARLLPASANEASPAETERRRVAATVVGPDGRFALEAERGGPHALELWNAGHEPVFCVVRDELELVPGATRRVELAYSTGRLEGVDELGAADLHHVWRAGAGLMVTTRIEADAAGRIDVRVPAGRAELVRAGQVVGEVDLDPGGALALQSP